MVILKTLCLELTFRQIIHKIFVMYVDDISERRLIGNFPNWKAFIKKTQLKIIRTSNHTAKK